MTLPKKIPAESDMPNKPMWGHENVLLDTGEPKGDKEYAACVIPCSLHMTACFDGACCKKKGVGGFMIYGSEG